MHLIDIFDKFDGDALFYYVDTLNWYNATTLDWYIVDRLDNDALAWVDILYNDTLKFKI